VDTQRIHDVVVAETHDNTDVRVAGKRGASEAQDIVHLDIPAPRRGDTIADAVVEFQSQPQCGR
jgi:hypothetical protein